MADHYPIASQIVDSVETRFEHVPVSVPDYDKFKSSTIVTGKKGRTPGELSLPRGVAIDGDTHQIFVANYNNHRVEIFSEIGEYICQLGVGQLYNPCGIAIHKDNVYVSCNDHTVSRFSLTDMSLVRRIGGKGLNNGEFHSPRQLTTDPTGRVFIPDSCNHRICIHDTNLNYLNSIMHQSMSYPSDIKISGDRMYVLCPSDNPCIQVLTLQGDKLHSLITLGKGMDVLHSLFCLDPLNNFVISDTGSHLIRVFSPEGNLLHTIGRKGRKQRMFSMPHGITITPNRRLVSVSNIMNYGLQIFC